jgi:hypothetical protein
MCWSRRIRRRGLDAADEYPAQATRFIHIQDYGHKKQPEDHAPSAVLRLFRLVQALFQAGLHEQLSVFPVIFTQWPDDRGFRIRVC